MALARAFVTLKKLVQLVVTRGTLPRGHPETPVLPEAMPTKVPPRPAQPPARRLARRRLARQLLLEPRPRVPRRRPRGGHSAVVAPARIAPRQGPAPAPLANLPSGLAVLVSGWSRAVYIEHITERKSLNFQSCPGRQAGTRAASLRPRRASCSQRLPSSVRPGGSGGSSPLI